jgi:hypothetical protein
MVCAGAAACAMRNPSKPLEMRVENASQRSRRRKDFDLRQSWASCNSRIRGIVDLVIKRWVSVEYRISSSISSPYTPESASPKVLA